MKRRMAWRFTCEHCGKSSCSGGHISKHERFCTKNPARDCRMCRMVGNEPVPMATLLEAVEFAQDPNMGGITSDDALFRSLDLTRVRALCGGCPACLLAVVRQLKTPEGISITDSRFSWKEEREKWLNDYRAAHEYVGHEGDQRFEREIWDEIRRKGATP